jgi:hypothetical protein
MADYCLLNGSLHPEAPQTRLSVHIRANPPARGTMELMVSHPVCSPFAIYCTRNKQMPGGKAAQEAAWKSMTLVQRKQPLPPTQMPLPFFHYN